MAASAAGGDTQKQLLSIIRGFASEKSQGERRLSDLNRRLADARAASEAALEELDVAKRAREEAERDLRASQAQAAIADATIHALEAKNAGLQEEISKASSDLDALKATEDRERDEFIRQMHEMNAKIRESIDLRQNQQVVSEELPEGIHCVQQPADACSSTVAVTGTSWTSDSESMGFLIRKGQPMADKCEATDSDVIDLASNVSNLEAEARLLEEEYEKDLLEHDKVLRELSDVLAKRTLMEALMGDIKQVQELGERSAELEKMRASLAEELQRRYICPGCGVNNMAGLEEAGS